MKRYLYILVCVMAWAGCALCGHAQQLYTTIEVLQPAELKLNNPIRSLLIVNNTVAQPEDFGHQLQMNGNSLGKQHVDLSEAAKNCLFGVAATLEQQELFDEVSLLPTTLNSSTNFYSRNRLSPTQTDSLCRLYGADAVLVLNQLVLYDLQDSWLTDEDNYYAFFEAYCSGHWMLYYKGKSTPQVFAMADTLAWEHQDLTQERAIWGLPNRQEALLDFSLYAGEHWSQKLGPQWKKVDRYFYRNRNEQIVAGIEYMRHQQWEEAIRQWRLAYDAARGSSSRKRELETIAYAAADIAVVYEIMDDYSSAIDWTEKAIAAFKKMKTSPQQVVNLQYYLTQLKERKEI